MKTNIIQKLLLTLLMGLGLNYLTQAQTMVSYRYWFDNNISTATSVSITAAQSVNISGAIATNILSNGYHTITVQGKDASGIYSSPITHSFVRSGFDVTAYEYWWDANYANHTTVAVTAAQNVDVTTSIPATGINPAMHLFAIRFKDLNGNWSVPLQDTVNIISGIQQLASVSNISLSPNPAHNNATLKFEGAGDDILTITITDEQGKSLRHHQLQNSFAQQQYEINTEGLAAGLYFIQLSSDKGSVVKKLMVQ